MSERSVEAKFLFSKEEKPVTKETLNLQRWSLSLLPLVRIPLEKDDHQGKI